MKNIFFLLLALTLFACNDDLGELTDITYQFSVEKRFCDKDDLPVRYVLRNDGLYRFTSYDNVTYWCGTCLMSLPQDEQDRVMEENFQNSHVKVSSNKKETATQDIYEALPEFLTDDSGATYGCNDGGQECRYQITLREDEMYQNWTICTENEDLLTEEQLAWKQELDALFEVLD